MPVRTAGFTYAIDVDATAGAAPAGEGAPPLPQAEVDLGMATDDRRRGRRRRTPFACRGRAGGGIGGHDMNATPLPQAEADFAMVAGNRRGRRRRTPFADRNRIDGAIGGHGFMVLMLAFVFCIAFAGAVPDSAFADAEHNRVAPAAQTAKSRALLLEGMKPITADQVKEGIYDIDAAASSPFFKITGATLTVRDGAMTAELALDSKSYPLVYGGTAQEAAEAPYDDYIEFDGDAWTFTVPIQALDQEIDCAAYSKRRKQWYDRKIMLYAATLPEGALLVDAPVYGDPIDQEDAAKTAQDLERDDEAAGEAVAVDMPDGEYSIEVNMTGGSGRASVSSPTWLIVQDGRAYARLLWSSSYYDYMIVDDEKYLNQTDDGSNSTFVIPITAMDEEIVVIGDTTAMGDPVEVEYHLTFYSDTIDVKDAIPQEAAIKVLYIAIAVIVVGGVLNYVLKRRRKR